MPFCAQCGAENKGESRFCYNCGTQVTPAQDAGAQQPTVQPQQPGNPQSAYQPYQQSSYQAYQQPERTYAPDGDARSLGIGAVSVLAYYGILFFVPLFAYKDSKFARFHAGQGLNVLLFSIAYSIVAGILSAIFMAISFGLGAAISGLLSLGGIFFFVVMIIGIVNVCKGEMKPLPVIGNIQIIKL